MKVITWIVRILVLIVLIWLALLNNDPVTYRNMDGIQFELPLTVLLFAFFILGVILGVFLLLPKNLSLRWEARKMRKEIEQHKSLLVQQKGVEQSALDASVATELPLSSM